MKNVFTGHSTDVVADRIFRSLLRDFRAVHGQDFARNAELALNDGIPAFRSYEWPKIGIVDPHRFKCWYQLRSLFKRHIFSSDVYTPGELETKTIETFLESQAFFGVWREKTPRTHAVLQEARRISRSILGEFSYDEAASYVKIGRRATLGGPLHQAFLDRKVGDPGAFTCPTAARMWFFTDYLQSDPVMKRLVRKIFRVAKENNIPLNLAADFLNLVTVPKSWKILRGITPMTLIGLFLSYAIGGLVTERLRTNAKLDIKRLQAKHRRLARRFSRSNTHATVDLRSASDSVMSQHLNAVLPRSWYRAIRTTFVRQLCVKGHEQNVYSCSVLPMGNGATFPVETLFFYCLIKAIGNLLGAKGVYSVYGDDLIYPSRIHSYVLTVFGELGLRVNDDKTFVDSSFRESCGGDYYRGIDVRPALLPENECRCLKGKRYAQYLYTIANGLRARWCDEEIPSTLYWLQRELATTQRRLFQVPMHFPATSGWKVRKPFVNSKEWQIPWAHPKVSFQKGCTVVRFSYLGQTTPRLRPVENEEVYYWDSLRAMSTRKPDKEWRFWKTWLVEVPRGEVSVGSHSYFKYVTFKVKDRMKRPVKRIVVFEPSREAVGLSVVDEVVSLDFWTQDPS